MACVRNKRLGAYSWDVFVAAVAVAVVVVVFVAVLAYSCCVSFVFCIFCLQSRLSRMLNQRRSFHLTKVLQEVKVHCHNSSLDKQRTIRLGDESEKDNLSPKRTWTMRGSWVCCTVTESLPFTRLTLQQQRPPPRDKD